MRIAIILLNWNGKNDTLECLCSLKELTYSNYQVLLADNGSTDGSIEAIRKAHPNVVIINNQTNLGFAEGNNRAISYALDHHFDAILLLNNDTIVAPNLLDAFVKTSQTLPHAILGAKIYLYSEKTTFDHFGGLWNLATGQFDLVGYRKHDDHLTWENLLPLDYVCGCALFAPASIFRKIGLFDARFFLFWEESDLCYRAKQQGYSILLCPEAKLWHKVSASFTGGAPHVTYYWWRNRLLWIEKHIGLFHRCRLYCCVILPEINKLVRHFMIKSLCYLWTPASRKRHLLDKIFTYKVALCGIYHYFRRRFYAAPAWVAKKRKNL